eukprot:scaffold13845_cov42-Cyclotella_meneghiniana.AAC.2
MVTVAGEDMGQVERIHPVKRERRANTRRTMLMAMLQGVWQYFSALILAAFSATNKSFNRHVYSSLIVRIIKL